jgi:hypothetical protein
MSPIITAAIIIGVAITWRFWLWLLAMFSIVILYVFIFSLSVIVWIDEKTGYRKWRINRTLKRIANRRKVAKSWQE